MPCVHFRTQRHNFKVQTLGPGLSSGMPHTAIPTRVSLSMITSHPPARQFPKTYPPSPPPPPSCPSAGREPSGEPSGFKGARGGPTMVTSPRPWGYSALQARATSPTAMPAAHSGVPAQTHVGPKKLQRTRPERVGQVRISKTSLGTETWFFLVRVGLLSPIPAGSLAANSRGVVGGRVILAARRVRGGSFEMESLMPDAPSQWRPVPGRGSWVSAPEHSSRIEQGCPLGDSCFSEADPHPGRTAQK